MKQYKEHLEAILAKGTHKPAARENMPGTISLFGYQWRHDLSEGFPLLTTKKTYWKGVVTELLWFLKGNTNVKYLNDNGVTFWNEDAYAYYLKQFKGGDLKPMSFEQFEDRIKNPKGESRVEGANYKLGDCGKQYGWLWRNWETQIQETYHENEQYSSGEYKWKSRYKTVDQLKELINGLKSNPMGRRHIISAWNPTTLNDMALNACHAFVQFNCRPIIKDTHINGKYYPIGDGPDYFIDCQLFQRSADMLLGVPLNVASYALLTHIIAKICNMIPEEMIYSYGDSHIYDNHIEQVKEQLSREERPLPILTLKDEFHYICDSDYSQADPLTIIDKLQIDWFKLEGYDPHPPIKGELSTGLIK